jgi:hypothetical protein
MTNPPPLKFKWLCADIASADGICRGRDGTNRLALSSTGKLVFPPFSFYEGSSMIFTGIVRRVISGPDDSDLQSSRIEVRIFIVKGQASAYIDLEVVRQPSLDFVKSRYLISVSDRCVEFSFLFLHYF